MNGKIIKQLLIKAVHEIPESDSRMLLKLLSHINAPLIKNNVEKWCKMKGLPTKMAEYLTMTIIDSQFSVKEKIEMSEMLANDEKFLDFPKLVKSSVNKVTDVSSKYKHKQYGDYLFKVSKNNNDKQLLGAPTAIGKGEIAFIIVGGLKKPTQGDLESNNDVIELKEPSAYIGPKGISHPSKTLKEMRSVISGLTDAPLPPKDRSVGRGASAKDALSKLLEIKMIGAKTEFPLGDWAKENNVPVATVKKILNEYHKRVYPFTFDTGKYVNMSYKFDYKNYGRDSFAALFEEYKNQSAFNTLMVLDVNTEKVYTIRTGNDAKKLFDQAGKVHFSGQDAHGLDGAIGGRIDQTKFKRLF